MTNEDSVLEEAMDNLREAAQRIRATQNVMHARGMTREVNYRELLVRLSTALAMTERRLMWRQRGGETCSLRTPSTYSGEEGQGEGPRRRSASASSVRCGVCSVSNSSARVPPAVLFWSKSYHLQTLKCLMEEARSFQPNGCRLAASCRPWVV